MAAGESRQIIVVVRELTLPPSFSYERSQCDVVVPQLILTRLSCCRCLLLSKSHVVRGSRGQSSNGPCFPDARADRGTWVAGVTAPLRTALLPPSA